MTKADYLLLEKCYNAEIEAALAKWDMPPVFQTKSKRMERLKEMGLVEFKEYNLGGRFPVTVAGWRLTLLGNMTYCFICE